MRNKTLWVFIGVAIITGCASVQVKAPKEPIKMDISMRLDVYQHVAKDIDDIESIVSGGKSAGPGNLLVGTAHAEEAELAPEATQAAYRRRDRKNALESAISKGMLAEGSEALISVNGNVDTTARQLAQEENADRMIIYRAIANKNGSSVAEVQKIYAKRLRGD